MKKVFTLAARRNLRIAGKVGYTQMMSKNLVGLMRGRNYIFGAHVRGSLIAYNYYSGAHSQHRRRTFSGHRRSMLEMIICRELPPNPFATGV